MANERQVPEGQVNVIKTRSTQDVLEDLKNEAKNLEAKKYKPNPDVPQYKGRTPVATRTTNTVDEKNKKEAQAEAANNYQVDIHSPYYGVDPREAEHKKHPPRTTQQALTEIEKREEEGEVETQKREDAVQKAAEADGKKVSLAKRDAYLAGVTAQQDGSFKPPKDPPETYDELTKIKKPTADWPDDKFVTTTKDGKKWTWKRGAWRPPVKKP